MLKVENISTGYYKKQVLFDVSFEVKKGEIVLLIGSNGSGKSTLLKAIYRMLPLWNNGQIFFDGENKKYLKQRIENSLSIFTTLIPLLNRTPMNLSGGERQLLTLAMAVLHQPKIILYDEPFTGLSPQNITFIAENLKALNEENGVTLLIVEHRVKECFRIADRVIGLKLGMIFCNAKNNEMFNINEFNTLFL